jgi:hypothetical protein
MTIRRLTLALVFGAALIPAAASAQEDGVFVDPDSPARDEYAIPAEEARGQADPGPDRRAPNGGPTGSPAFGAGLGDDGGDGSGEGSDGGSGGGSDGGSGGSSGGGGDSDRADPRGVDEDARRVLSAAGSSPVPDGGTGTVLAILASGALVVLAGAGGGALLRRRRRQA